ncbi:MAG TPA: efflux RND transporter periplasmic adaptor subunit [Gemmatimonadales bacterium]|nr:efflux RND transporter periplasmic adaptor subunit [Gemmatimonadales bacterium]
MTTPSADLSRLTINRDAPSRGVRRAFRTTVLIAAGAVVLVAAVLWVLRARAAPVVRVATATLVGGGGAGAAGVVANGYVVARTQASVSAKLPGRLAYLGVSEGSHVVAGQLIARLDNADYTAAVGQAEANLAAERATLIEARADRDELVREARRAQDVHAQNAQLISQQGLDSADSRAAQAVARAQAESARVDAAASALGVARANLENTLIRAPFTGVVLTKDAEVGEVVAPSVGGGLTRGAVVTMADFATLEVEVDVNEAYIARIRAGEPARITLDAYPDTAFRGSVRLVVPTADRQKATVQVKVSIRDHDPRILPEMGARVEFLEPAHAGPGPAPRPRVSVPADAVHSDGAETIVWLVKDGRLERRVVDAGPTSGGMREVRAGLAGGEVLVTGGLENPAAGMRVVVKP